MSTIEISKEEYESLLRQSRILEALYAAGVDNWEGWECLPDGIFDQKGDKFSELSMKKGG